MQLAGAAFLRHVIATNIVVGRPAFADRLNYLYIPPIVAQDNHLGNINSEQRQVGGQVPLGQAPR
jgi:hypothetical protein